MWNSDYIVWHLYAIVLHHPLSLALACCSQSLRFKRPHTVHRLRVLVQRVRPERWKDHRQSNGARRPNSPRGECTLQRSACVRSTLIYVPTNVHGVSSVSSMEAAQMLELKESTYHFSEDFGCQRPPQCSPAKLNSIWQNWWQCLQLKNASN